MVITFYWRYEHGRPLSNDLEKLRSEHKQTCEVDLKQSRGNMEFQKGFKVIENETVKDMLSILSKNESTF